MLTTIRSFHRGEISSLPIMASQVASSVPAVISSANNANSEKDAQVPQLMADYFLSIDKVPEAFGLLCDILALPSTSGPTLVPYLLKLANLHMTRSSSPLTALPLILMSLALGSQFHVVPDQLEASLKLASILLHFEGLAQRSLQLCEKAMPSILTSGPLAAKGEAWLTQARCLIACAGDLEGESASEARLELFEAALDALDRAKQGELKSVGLPISDQILIKLLMQLSRPLSRSRTSKQLSTTRLEFWTLWADTRSGTRRRPFARQPESRCSPTELAKCKA